MTTSIIIPAKGHSERVPRKNLLKLGSKSLVFLACEKCLSVDNIDHVYLDTESQEIIDDVSSLDGLKIIRRPVELASNKYGGNELIVFEQQHIVPSDIILHTYASSPLITAGTISNCLEMFKDYPENDSFFTAIHLQEYIWDDNGPINFTLEELPNAVDLPSIWMETHGLYGIRNEALTKYKRRLGNAVLPIEIPREQALDINYKKDMKLLEVLHE